MIPVLDARAMRAADAAAIRGGTPSLALMEAAASAIAAETLAEFPRWETAAVVCGPGNNGGDGLAAARLLAEEGIEIRLFLLARRDAYRGDPAENLVLAEEAGLEPVSLADPRGFSRLAAALAECDGVVDALFGTGLTRPLEGAAMRAVTAIVRSGKPVVSADLPSGVSSDSGAIPGPAVRASLTVAFAAPKLCHVFPPARGLCGRVVVRDIGIDVSGVRRSERARIDLVEESDVAALLPRRRPDSNKGDYGRVAIVAGSVGKAGAAALAARGAIRGGAGLVTVFCAESIQSVPLFSLPEAMTHPLPERDGVLAPSAAAKLVRALGEGGFDAAVVGPGLTTGEGPAAVVRALLETRLALVCDADALNLFAGEPAAFKRRAPTVLTPHPGEAGRLLGSSASAVQKDRLGSARRLAKESRAAVALKGDGTLVAAPSGRVTVNSSGTPLLATGGTGDVLAGEVGALLAGGLDAMDAAIGGVWLHGRAGEILARRLGDAGLLARELAGHAARRARRAAFVDPVSATPGGAPSRTRSEGETEALGAALASGLAPTDVVYIHGPLGAGKTAFARGLARGLSAAPGQVASPTFAILHEYADTAGRIVLRHLDLYRIEDRVQELARIGVPDALAGAPVAVEWPGEAIRALLPPTVEVEIARAGEAERSIEIRRSGVRTR